MIFNIEVRWTTIKYLSKYNRKIYIRIFLRTFVSK